MSEKLLNLTVQIDHHSAEDAHKAEVAVVIDETATAVETVAVEEMIEAEVEVEEATLEVVTEADEAEIKIKTLV